MQDTINRPVQLTARAHDAPRGRNAMKHWQRMREAAPFRHATINDGNTPADRKTIAAALLKRERKATARLA